MTTAESLGVPGSVQRRRRISSTATSRRGAVPASPSSAATSASPTPSSSSASIASARPSGALRRPAGGARRAPAARRPGIRLRLLRRHQDLAPCRFRSTRSGKPPTTARAERLAARVLVVSAGAAAGSRRRFPARPCAGAPSTWSSAARDCEPPERRSSAAGARDPRCSTPNRPAATLRRSGCTRPAAPAAPKGCVHLQHDMVVCAELFAKGRPRHQPARLLLQRGQAVLRLRPRQRAVLPLRGWRDQHSLARAADAAHVLRPIERHRPTLFFSVPTGYGMLLAHAPERATSICRPSGSRSRPAKRCRRRSTSDSRQRFGIDILDGIGSTEALHMFISNRPGAIRPGSSGLLVRGYDARIVDDDGAPVAAGRDRQPVDQRRLDVRVLLEPAREDQGHDPRPLAPHRRQVPRTTPTATSGTRADPTTC